MATAVSQKRSEAQPEIPTIDSKIIDEYMSFMQRVAELQKSVSKDFTKLEHAAFPKLAPLLKQRAEHTSHIKDFWLEVLRSQDVLGILLEDEQTVDAMSYLTDISTTLAPESSKYTITFHFKSNPFFTNQTLFLTCEPDQETVVVKDKSPIRWMTGKSIVKSLAKKNEEMMKQDPEYPPMGTIFELWENTDLNVGLLCDVIRELVDNCLDHYESAVFA
ncbi:putative Nucleosome assembly protein (NAP) [Blattamonas nauphoetae]|uniref:Nucleosome assembly protein (NAP) n=1 Tax=Blattamonas nauphoetae TaxID=2049346 RepID=A0ABQ9Y0H7_9EUKA|nr:putative Nucleosome assembly protein (NAP) [Blattamonas nauphoetae]